jgi:hypothetical protein
MEEQEVHLDINEINALNKLLGLIKSESYLSSDEINQFALSPFISSLHKKVHQKHMDSLREQQKNGQLKTLAPLDLDPSSDFKLHPNTDIQARLERLNNSNENLKKHISSLDPNQLEEFVQSLFSPFKATKNQTQESITFLKEL